MTSRLIELSQQFQNQGSGWQFSKVEALDILTDPFQPLSGSTYIPLSKSIADRNAIINVNNSNDNDASSGLSLQLFILLRTIRKD